MRIGTTDRNGSEIEGCIQIWTGILNKYLEIRIKNTGCLYLPPGRGYPINPRLSGLSPGQNIPRAYFLKNFGSGKREVRLNLKLIPKFD